MRTRAKLFSLVLLSCTVANVASAEQYLEKHVVFPKGATLEQKVDIASRLVPSPQQLMWQKLEFTAFLHFGMNTFTGNEWGTGKEDPKIFNPQKFDADQWAKTLKDAGFRMAIITAKHHDGFCLWQTATTKHSVASSPWKDGKGDIVKDLKRACDKYGLKFGVYLSPWDRNAESYGDSDRYNKFFIDQLTELLTQYGRVDEVWFDGACGEGPNGKKQVYDWTAFRAKIKELQPQSVVAITGDDVRWVGNESGMGRDTEWSASTLVPSIFDRSVEQNKDLGIDAMSKDLGSREMLSKAPEIFWHPAEVDVSIRPGWFYHEHEDDKVRSLASLVDIGFKSIGCNAVLLLNIPPDKDGLINSHDVNRLNEFAAYWGGLFANNLIKKGASTKVMKPGDSVIYDIKPTTANTFMIQEDITRGQRVEEFTIEGLTNGKWIKLADATTVGYKKLVRTLGREYTKIKFTLVKSRGTVRITNFGAYYAPPIAPETVVTKINDLQGLRATTTGAETAIDANLDTHWTASMETPLMVDLGEETEIAGFRYFPVKDEDKGGTVFTYNLYGSIDGTTWKTLRENGEFSNIMHNPIPQEVRFWEPQKVKYLKFVPTTTIDHVNTYKVGEFGIIKK